MDPSSSSGSDSDRGWRRQRASQSDAGRSLDTEESVAGASAGASDLPSSSDGGGGFGGDGDEESSTYAPAASLRTFDADDLSVSSRGDFSHASTHEAHHWDPAAPAPAQAPAAAPQPRGPPPPPSSYSGPFSSAAAAFAATPVVGGDLDGAGIGSGLSAGVGVGLGGAPPASAAAAVPSSSASASASAPPPAAAASRAKAKAAAAAAATATAAAPASSSWRGDWDREEAHHALAKSLQRHRRVLKDTYKLRDSRPGVDASEYDSDDTARSEATERTGVGGPGIVPSSSQQQQGKKDKGGGGDGTGDEASDAGSLGGKSAGSSARAGSASTSSSKMIQPRADVLGARGLMAKHRKNKDKKKKEAAAKAASDKTLQSESSFAEDPSSPPPSEAVPPAERKVRRGFNFITSACGDEEERRRREMEAPGPSGRRSLRRGGGRGRGGDGGGGGPPLRRCGPARRVCVAVCAAAAVAAAVVAGLALPDSVTGRTLRRTAGEVGVALRVAVSGSDSDSAGVDFAEAREETAAARTAAKEREEALPMAGGGGGRRDEQMDRKRIADAMSAAGGQGGTIIVAHHSASSGRLGEDSYVLGMGGGGYGGGGSLRNLGMLHSRGQYRGLAHPGEPHANVLPQYGGITSPSVLPPLDSYNTAKGPDDEGIYVRPSTSVGYADVWDSVTALDVPVLWRIPRSGASTVQAVLGRCLGAVQASEMGREMEARFFRSMSITVHADDRGSKYVNVDTTTAEGLRRAKRLGVAASSEGAGASSSSSVVDVVVTPLLQDASVLFDSAHRGRAFAMFRHPVRRIASAYFSLGDDDGGGGGSNGTGEEDEVKAAKARAGDMSLLEYATSDLSDENLVVRSLSGDPVGPITPRHVEVAKEVIRRKVLVGITESLDESLVRFERYVGWWDAVADDPRALRCQGETTSESGDGRRGRPSVPPGTEEFRAIAERNWADVELYGYAKTLFREQASLV